MSSYKIFQNRNLIQSLTFLFMVIKQIYKRKSVTCKNSKDNSISCKMKKKCTVNFTVPSSSIFLNRSIFSKSCFQIFVSCMVEQTFLDESCDELANFQLKILREKVEKLTKRNAELGAEKKKSGQFSL